MSVRILIVEDDVALVGRKIEKYLTRNGFDVVGIANTRSKAIVLAKQYSPELIFMDIDLGKRDPEGGLAVTHEICALMNPKIVYMTGLRVTEDLMSKVAATSPFGFVPKPVREVDVVSQARLVAATRERRKVVFLCYSHQDSGMQSELMEFLSAMNSIGVDPWVDTKIPAGHNWKAAIEASLRQAQVAIVLVSISMINSEFIRKYELPKLLEANKSRGMTVIPVFVGAVPASILASTGLQEFKGINSPVDPLDAWDAVKRRGEAWVRLCDQLG